MLRHRGALGLLLTLAMVVAACGDDATTTTQAPATTEAPATTVAPATTTVIETFDIVQAAADYTTTIPEGWMAVGDLTAFKDAVAAGAYLIDVREVGEYEAGHIEGAINIPLRTLTQNLDLVPTDRQVFIYCKSGYRGGMALTTLRMLGYDNVLTYTPGFDGWSAAGEAASTDPVDGETFPVPDFEPELFAALDEFITTIPEGWLMAGDIAAVKAAVDAGAFLLDIRTPAEFAEGFIPGATLATLRELPLMIDAIPTDQPIVVYCKSGLRASLAMPVLHVLGFDTTKAFVGGFNAWTAAGEEIATP